MIYDFIVIGAGLSGLLVADNLQKNGHSVLVVEKSKSSGGRLATRRIESFFCDHGLQYFEPTILQQTLLGRQWMDLFLDAFKTSENGFLFSKYGMTEIPKKMSSNLNIIYNEKVQKIAYDQDIYQIFCESEKKYQTRTIISAQPWTQFRDIMIASQLTDDVIDAESVIYSQCLVAFVNRLAVVNANQSSFNVFDQSLKYIGNKCVVIQASPYWSEKYFNHSDEDIKLQFIKDLNINHTDILDIKKWRYANNQNSLKYDYYQNKKYPSVFAVGDYFKYNGIKSVFNSVERLLNTLNNKGDNHV